MSKALGQKSYEELYEELCKLPDNVVGQILDGELVVMPRPAPKHAQASSSLGGKLSDPFHSGRGGPGGWRILDEPEIRLGGHVMAPDIVGWKRERMPQLPEKAYFELSPDWVCEVLSPSTARYDKISKLRIYAENNVPYYWIIDPNNKTLEVFILERHGFSLGPKFEGEDKVSVPPFEAIEFDLGDLWED